MVQTHFESMFKHKSATVCYCTLVNVGYLLAHARAVQNVPTVVPMNSYGNSLGINLGEAE